MKYTTESFLHHELIDGSKRHYRVWGIVPVDKEGRHGYPIRNNEKLIFETRKEAMKFIEEGR